MTNRSSSGKKHGMTKANEWRPKSAMSRRKNKRNAQARKTEANKAWQEMLKGS